MAVGQRKDVITDEQAAMFGMLRLKLAHTRAALGYPGSAAAAAPTHLPFSSSRRSPSHSSRPIVILRERISRRITAAAKITPA